MRKKFVILLSLGLMTLSLSGCGNTLNGMGKDLENWGNAIQRTF